MSIDLTIRKANEDDAVTLYAFMAGLIDDHVPGQSPWTSASQLRLDGFGVDPLFEAMIAEKDSNPIGFVSFFRGYAGWRGKPMGIIHALYVTADYRRLGVAKALVGAVARIACDRGWCRIELFVEEGRPAQDFYQSIGMRDLHHQHFRLDGRTLVQLAQQQ